MYDGEYLTIWSRPGLEGRFSLDSQVLIGCWRLGRIADPSNGQGVFFSGVCDGALVGEVSDIWTGQFSEGSEAIAIGTAFVELLNTEDEETDPALTSDGRAIYFSRSSATGEGSANIVMATRSSLSSSFILQEGVVAAINSDYAEMSPTVTSWR